MKGFSISTIFFKELMKYRGRNEFEELTVNSDQYRRMIIEHL